MAVADIRRRLHYLKEHHSSERTDGDTVVTALTVFSPAEASLFAKICGLLGSSFDGERAAAAFKAIEFLKPRGLSWGEFVALTMGQATHGGRTRHPWRATVHACLAKDELISDWERGFLLSIRERPRLTPKQWAVLERIAENVLGETVC